MTAVDAVSAHLHNVDHIEEYSLCFDEPFVDFMLKVISLDVKVLSILLVLVVKEIRRGALIRALLAVLNGAIEGVPLLAFGNA